MQGTKLQPARPSSRERPSADLKVLPITVQAQTVAKLRNAILTGVFAPGDRLVEADLCARMGVSRTSIREALRRLEAERLIAIVPNRGPSVAVIDWPEAREIYDVRALLEGEAAALFARRATAPQLQVMSSALADFEAAVRTNNALRRLATTQRFYGVVLDGCGNRIINEILQGLTARITFLRARSMSRAGRASESAAEMLRILQAIEQGNPRAARAAAVAHVVAAAQAAARTFDQDSRSGQM
jgi:DNA-binding GntR family transcriptional regulator